MMLSRFTDFGIYLFNEYLDKLEEVPQKNIPKDLLTSNIYSEVLTSEVDVCFFEHKTRFSIARYLHTVLNETGLTDLERDIKLWAWLTAFFFDILCPVDSSGKRKLRERAAYIPEPGNYRRYYRHLLLGPYLIFRAHIDNPERAMALLCKPPHIITDIEGQIAASQELITNKSVVELTTKLYYDPSRKTTKKGAGGKGPGSPRRLVSILNQFDKTWDLYATSTDELLKLLPKEFDSFLKAD